MNSLRQIYFALTKVLKERKYFLIFLIATVVFFGIFIMIPVLTIPGNSVSFQLSIYTRGNYILMSFLAILVGVTFATQIYVARKQRALRKYLSPVLKGAGLSAASGVFGSIVGTASCASCLASLFGLLGLGAGGVFLFLKTNPIFCLGQ